MKTSRITTFIMAASLFAAAVAGTSCQQHDPLLFGEETSVYFNPTTNYTYSFLENPGATEVTIACPLLVMGRLSDRDRTVNAELYVIEEAENYDEDNEEHQALRNTANPALYRILEGIVPAGSSTGTFYIELYYGEELEEGSQVFHIRVVANEDFPEINYQSSNRLKVEFGAVEMKPANWDNMLVYYFGKYSDNWWKFIKEATSRTSIPFWGGTTYDSNPDPEIWWMEPDEFNALVTTTRRALRDYNLANPNDKLKHDDGTDDEVVMPEY